MGKKWVVYCHTNKINGKKYIGITSQMPEKRWGNGCNYKEKNQTKFFRAIKKYGWDNFEHEIIEKDIPTLEEANEKERYYIEFYDSFKKGYNSTHGGDGATGYKHTKEEKEKISKNNARYWKGKHLKQEAIEKRRKKITGLKQSQETINKRIAKTKGQKRTEEFKQYCRELMIERYRNILQYDLQGNFIKEFLCAKDASKETGAHASAILKVCKGKGKTAGGYIWKYA